MRKKYFMTGMAIMMTLSLAACGGSASSGQAGDSGSTQAAADSDSGSSASGETVTINIGHGGAESTAQQVGCLALKDYLEENSGGAMTVNIYPNNSMGNDDELCQMVQSGNLEMCLANSIIVNYRCV